MPEPHQRTNFWIAAEVVLNARWAFTPRVFLQTDGGVVFPAARTQYFFQPGTPVYTLPPAAALAFLGAGVSS